MLRLARRAAVAPGLATVVLSVAALAPDGAAASTVTAVWHMNETSGTTMYDSSGHHINGTLHNVKLGVAGKSGKSYTFGGAAAKSYVSVPNVASLNPGSANITISFWLKTTSLPKSGDFDLVRKGVWTAPEYKVELLGSGQVQCTFRGSTSNHNATGGSHLNNGKWHHVTCIKTATQIETVIDGKTVATTKAVVGAISNSYAVEIGAYPGADWYQGQLDEVSIALG